MATFREKSRPKPLGLHRLFHWRLIFLTLFFFALLAAVVLRVFSVSIVEHRRFVLAAEQQHGLFQVLPSRRGTVYAQDKSGALHPLAIQKTFFTVIAVPNEVEDPEGTAKVLGELLPREAAEIPQRLLKFGDPYEVLARKVDEATAERIRALHLAGLNLVEESRRIYPQGKLAASVLGFVTYDDGKEEGAYGIEQHYQTTLAGERGFFEGEKDAGGYWVALGKRILNPPVHGTDVVLTIDANIQFKLEEELDLLREKWQPELATGVVLEPATGKILALAARPTYDPNAYSEEKDFSVFRTPIVDSQFELGSVFKPITMAAGINEGVITASTTYGDPGVRRFGTFSVSNFDGRSHGTQTMTQVLEKSLNTGAMFAMERVGKERFLEYLKSFGFGEPTGIDVPGELAGNISNLSLGRDVDYATASFGQGIAMTPLQIAMGMAAIANDGLLMRPYIVEKLVDDSGAEEIRRPQEVRRVISPESSETLTRMLVSAVRNGFENRAGVKGYFVAGKTGTAQIPFQDRRGYSDDVIHTFVGYAPAFQPRFLVLLELVKPRGNRFAANTLTPVFHNLAQFMLNYYEVPPDER